MRIPIGTWTMGKMSAFIMVLAMLTDFSVSHFHNPESHAFPDAVLGEAVRPSSRYQRPAQAGSGTSSRRQLGLGSAAISSVTEALSPILPFTGGVDLRREDYWASLCCGWVKSLSTAFVAKEHRKNVASSEADAPLWNVPRGGGNVPQKLSGATPTKAKHDLALSAQDPFVSKDLIAELTLTEVSETVRYAVESSKKGFNEAKYLNELMPRMKKVIGGINDAVAKSRGKSFQDCSVANEDAAAHSGAVDALKFSAAMRIFAEWRVLRQVPEGYKGYAVGMNLGHKDVVQNVAKIEQAVHSWLDYQRDACYIDNDGSGEAEVRCSLIQTPTIKQLLEHERDLDMHPTLPRLKDKTAAMGLLWVRRQLQYQTRLFDNVIKVPKRFPSTADAVYAAYKEVYDRYHGWAVQKIFTYSFQAAPASEEIYKHMNPYKLKEVTENAKGIKVPMHAPPQAPEPSNANGLGFLDHLQRSHSMNQPPKSRNPVEAFFKHVGGEWDKLAEGLKRKMVPIFKHVGGEWDKLAEGLKRKIVPKPAVAELVSRGGSTAGCVEANPNDMIGIDIDEYVTQEMVKDAHEHISRYLEIVDPVLNDIGKVFDEMNMDDPTKV